LPLIRVRVDHTGFPRITNINKFGQKFVGKVANPEELLLFSKQKAQSTRGTSDARTATHRRHAVINSHDFTGLHSTIKFLCSPCPC